MLDAFHVRVSKDQLGFCSGHFITYAGDNCERLHGHNYRVAVEVSSPLDDNHYVFDFIALNKLTRAICEELDHRMMLPTKSTLIRVEVQGAQVEVHYATRRWSFPLDDCVLLPIENTTAELLARYIANRLRTALREQHGYVPATLSVEVEESYGQSATFRDVQ
jgi:6-pyruvoyltetrahydropterin/6-carboxytetrahydropterin synthase